MGNETDKVGVALDALGLALGGAQAVANLGVLPEDVRPLVSTIARIGSVAVREIEDLRANLEAARSKPGGVTADDIAALNRQADEKEREIMRLFGIPPA